MTPPYFSHHTTGTYSVRTESGVTVEVKDGAVTAHLPFLKSVGIADLCEVESHTLHRLLGSVSHGVRFTGGGLLQFACNDRGELLEFSGLRISASVEPDGHVTVRAYQAPREGEEV